VPEDRQEMGYRELDPISIKRVDDRDGNVLWEYEQPDSRRILDPKLAYLMNNVLSDNGARSWAFGVENKLRLEDRAVAAKTGTTTAWHDSWTVGYTPQIATGVWVGNTDNTPMKHVPGSYGAAHIWNDVMKYAHEGLPSVEFERPDGIVTAQVCATSGLLPTENCPHVVGEFFIAGTEPNMSCSIHKAFNVNRETGRLATPNTPPELIEREVFAIFPPEADDWVREANIPQPPTEYDDYASSRETEDVAIVDPVTFGYISELVEIKGNARNNVRFWKLDYGQGIDPTEWVQIGGDHPYEVNGELMENWDVAGLDGLYTLRLTVVGQDDSIRQDIIQITVDNVPPRMELKHPEDGMVFVKEDDEWINVQATVHDNVSMDRVDFYLDGVEIGTSTVSPYNKSWTIVMDEDVPRLGPDPVGITLPITHTDGTVEERYFLSTSLWATRTITHADGTEGVEDYEAGKVLYDPELNHTFTWSEGKVGGGVIRGSDSYTETHSIHVVAIDAAGNEVESPPVQVYVIHKKKPQEETSVPHGALIWPVRRRQEHIDVGRVLGEYAPPANGTGPRGPTFVVEGTIVE
jgi:hypothetical protein